MPNRFLLVGLACLLFACSDSLGSPSGADVSGHWFSLIKGPNPFSVTNRGSYEFLHHPEEGAPRVLKRAAGNLDEPMIAQLKVLLDKELRRHYYDHRSPDEDRCIAEGYSLVHFGGCWIVDEVKDEKTKHMLEVLVPLFQEKEAEARAKPDVDFGDASVPSMTVFGTPHE